ncbi:unnamed protein product [Pieris macdunnoughi]|uniref:PiggyBac transposable element-derived protein domain-containing protein n=1 Tax=Pieris macdunnoughi TaxID=345717 RepID=A0A821MQP9_9NEOP|nr:unnamed protein product [Pieris macdunnoughi]
MMIPYKGRKAGNRKQYMKDKPSKWGFKNYVRAGVSGMIYDFILYAGEDTFRSHKFTEQESSLGFGAQIVIALTQTDNFFSSPELFYLLKENYGVFGLGTIRSNRIRGAEKLLPDEKISPTSPIRFDNTGHFPSTKEDMGRCKFCQKITTVYCIKCNVRLCFVTGKNPFKYKLLTNCFLHFHNK